MNVTHERGRALVFDFARVVFRWRPEVVIANALPHRHLKDGDSAHWVAQVFEAYGGDWEEFDRGTVDREELARRISKRTGLTIDEVRAVVAACIEELTPLPDTRAWLERLKAQGRRLHFLSNMPEPFARHFELTYDVVKLFESGVFSARVGQIKPEPEIYASAAKAFGLPPSELLFLDDVLPNVLAAREAGWQAIHFFDAAQAEAEVVALGW